MSSELFQKESNTDKTLKHHLASELQPPDPTMNPPLPKKRKLDQPEPQGKRKVYTYSACMYIATSPYAANLLYNVLTCSLYTQYYGNDLR